MKSSFFCVLALVQSGGAAQSEAERLALSMEGSLYLTPLVLLVSIGCGESAKSKIRAVEALERLDEYKRAGELL